MPLKYFKVIKFLWPCQCIRQQQAGYRWQFWQATSVLVIAWYIVNRGGGQKKIIIVVYPKRAVCSSSFSINYARKKKIFLKKQFWIIFHDFWSTYISLSQKLEAIQTLVSLFQWAETLICGTLPPFFYFSINMILKKNLWKC